MTDIGIEIIKIIASPIVGALAGAIVGAIFSAMREKRKCIPAKIDSIQSDTSTIMRKLEDCSKEHGSFAASQIFLMHSHSMRNGFCDAETLIEASKLYDVCHLHGFNGAVSERIRQMKELPREKRSRNATKKT